MPTIQWPQCQVCGKDVTTEQGVITIFGKDITEYETLYREWKESHSQQQNEGVYTSEDLAELPLMIDWHWGHDKCLKPGMYEITYDTFDTVEKAFAWTLHMMDKSWVNHTHWEEMVRAHYELPHL